MKHEIKKSAGGKGTGPYRRGSVLTSITDVEVGQLLVVDSKTYRATNLAKVTQTFSDKFYAVFANPESPAEKRQSSDEEFVVFSHDLDKGEYYIALEPAPGLEAPEAEHPAESDKKPEPTPEMGQKAKVNMPSKDEAIADAEGKEPVANPEPKGRDESKEASKTASVGFGYQHPIETIEDLDGDIKMVEEEGMQRFVSFIMADGGRMCYDAVKKEYDLVKSNTQEYLTDKGKNLSRNQWAVIGMDLNEEADDLVCDHMGTKIEPLYGSKKVAKKSKVSYDDDDSIRQWLLSPGMYDEGLSKFLEQYGLSIEDIEDRNSVKYKNFVAEHRTEIVDAINRDHVTASTKIAVHPAGEATQDVQANSKYALELATLLFISGFADEIERAEDDEENTSSGLKGVGDKLGYSESGMDLTEYVPEIMEEHGLKMPTAELENLGQELVNNINAEWEGKLTVDELLDKYPNVAIDLALGSQGHGVSPEDDPEVSVFMEDKGVSSHQLYQEGIGDRIRDEAYGVLSTFMGRKEASKKKALMFPTYIQQELKKEQEQKDKDKKEKAKKTADTEKAEPQILASWDTFECINAEVEHLKENPEELLVTGDKVKITDEYINRGAGWMGKEVTIVSFDGVDQYDDGVMTYTVEDDEGNQLDVTDADFEEVTKTASKKVAAIDLTKKWYDKGQTAGKKDTWMQPALEGDLNKEPTILSQEEQSGWEETDHFAIKYREDMMQDAMDSVGVDTVNDEVLNIYSDIGSSFWEGWLDGSDFYGKLEAKKKGASKTVKAFGEEPASAMERSDDNPITHSDPAETSNFGRYSETTPEINTPDPQAIAEITLKNGKVAKVPFDEDSTDIESDVEYYLNKKGVDWKSWKWEDMEEVHTRPDEYEFDSVKGEANEDFYADGPSDDDIVIDEDGRSASSAGKEIASISQKQYSDSGVDALAAPIMEWMDKHQYWPNVWQQKERGDVSQLVIKKKGSVDNFEETASREEPQNLSTGSSNPYLSELLAGIATIREAGNTGEVSDDGLLNDTPEASNFTGVNEHDKFDRTEAALVVDELLSAKAVSASTFDDFMGFMGDFYGISKEASKDFEEAYFNDDAKVLVSTIKNNLK